MATIRGLAEDARKLASSVLLSDPLPVTTLSWEKVESLKESTQLGDVVRLVSRKADDPAQQSVLSYQNIILLEALLRNPNGLYKDSQAGDQAAILQDYVVSTLTPPPVFAAIESSIPRTLSAGPKLDIVRFQLTGTAGLRALSSLIHHFPELHKHDTLNLIQCLACYTNCDDPWIRPGSDEVAEGLLKPLIEKAYSPQESESLLSDILLNIVRPVFAASKSNSITPAGRKAISSLPEPLHAHEDNLRLKPWRGEKFYVISILRWLIAQLTDKTAEKFWHLVTPPILALIDDGETISKLKGCDLLQTLLESAPSSLLLKTGLGEVFAEALFPLLSLLPTLTLEDESLSIQSSAYSTLLSLIRRQYVNHEGQQARRRLLDKMMRVGVLSGLAHSGEHVKLATLLLHKMSLIIDELGIWSAKHLKVKPFETSEVHADCKQHLVPLLKSYLCSPFVLSAFPLLEASVLAIQKVILTDWPRIEAHSIDIFQGICVCWHRNSRELPRNAHYGKIENMLQDTFGLLLAGLNGSKAKQDIVDTVQNDHRLRGLLQDAAKLNPSPEKIESPA